MDNAFKTAAYPAMTTQELRAAVVGASGERFEKLANEIARREAAASGDVSVMTQGERLRFARTGRAR